MADISPYDGFANTSLIFHVPTGEIVRSPIGNPVPQVVPVALSANLKMLALQSANQVRRQPGVDETAIKLEGYCVEPMILDLRVLPNNWADCTWSGTSGYFYLEAPINLPYGREGIGAICEETNGTKITGWFQVSRSS